VKKGEDRQAVIVGIVISIRLSTLTRIIREGLGGHLKLTEKLNRRKIERLD